MCIRDRVSTQSTGTPLIATMRFVLYYHPIPFRAQFMRVILEYTGTCYSEELPYELKLADPADPNTTAHFMAPPLPVSYTHLRAHETPEHLVCRLLLEKKKNLY
eukprot:TRINITY_DN60126_c0_g1_i2.p2 TRINITY_DN60126_c0_g1~~TRINITY_DN60126_c0_g1_i2.p2  ORF type:complete len:104 (+),score=33.71 TRINITY_DN60126_c0_g1_i2:172-483(+)